MKKFSIIMLVVLVTIMVFTIVVDFSLGFKMGSQEWHSMSKIMASSMLVLFGIYIMAILVTYACYWINILYHVFMVKVLKHNNHKKLAYVTIHQMEHLWD